MLGYVLAKKRKGTGSAEDRFAVPTDVERRLRAWIDVRAVGQDGFWIWFRAVLPLLPRTDVRDRGNLASLGTAREERRELEHRLVTSARENSRLAVLSDYRARENELLARRLRALEAALRTVAMAGHRVQLPPDPDADEVVERYAPGARVAKSRAPPTDGHRSS